MAPTVIDRKCYISAIRVLNTAWNRIISSFNIFKYPFSLECHLNST